MAWFWMPSDLGVCDVTSDSAFQSGHAHDLQAGHMHPPSFPNPPTQSEFSSAGHTPHPRTAELPRPVHPSLLPSPPPSPSTSSSPPVSSLSCHRTDTLPRQYCSHSSDSSYSASDDWQSMNSSHTHMHQDQWNSFSPSLHLDSILPPPLPEIDSHPLAYHIPDDANRLSGSIASAEASDQGVQRELRTGPCRD